MIEVSPGVVVIKNCKLVTELLLGFPMRPNPKVKLAIIVLLAIFNFVWPCGATGCHANTDDNITLTCSFVRIPL